MNKNITLFQDNFCRLTTSFYADCFGGFIPLTGGVAMFLKKHFENSIEAGYKWLTIYENL